MSLDWTAANIQPGVSALTLFSYTEPESGFFLNAN